MPFRDPTRILLQYARIWLLYTPLIVTPDIVFEVLHVPKVAHPDYLGCERLRTTSKDELSSLFCDTPSSWDDHQNTLCSAFAKGQRILNVVTTFVPYPLSHYNTITEPHAWFLLSLIEDLSIDFPSHFILSLIGVYKDTTTRDKLIFPSTITRLLHHFFISNPKSPHFTFMCAIDDATVKWSIAQLRSRQPQTETDTPPAPTALSSLTGGVTLEAIMAQLMCIDAHLDTLSDELCQVNTHVGRIARR